MAYVCKVGGKTERGPSETGQLQHFIRCEFK